VAVPFGGHPTLQSFLDWATENGCTAKIQTRIHSGTGQPYQSLEVSAPSGAQVAVVDPDLSERLAPSQVAYMQRRLGLKSPFPATPEHPKPSDTEYVKEDGQPFDPPRKGTDRFDK
jgi:hypothetical protein